MGWKYIIAVYASLISSACLAKYKKADVYRQVNVGPVPENPCDDWEFKMPDYNMPGRRVSEVKCLEYIWRMKYFTVKGRRAIACEYFKIGVHTTLIGGKPVRHGEYPHMAALGWKARVGTWIFKCGSSLISERFTLTAAHCASVSKDDPSVMEVEPKIVRLGSKNIFDTVDGVPAYDVEILKFIKYPRYNSLKQYYDIALVELVEEVKIQINVRPACLWSEFQNPDKGMVTGWGVVEVATAKTSPELQTAEIRIVDSKECDENLKFRRNRKWQGITRHQLCAGDKTGKIDTCQGDSGGPLQSLITLDDFFYWTVYKIVGVTSFGFGRARKDTPSIYTRVASFIDWIERIVWPINATSPNSVEDCLVFRS